MSPKRSLLFEKHTQRNPCPRESCDSPGLGSVQIRAAAWSSQPRGGGCPAGRAAGRRAWGRSRGRGHRTARLTPAALGSGLLSSPPGSRAAEQRERRSPRLVPLFFFFFLIIIILRDSPRGKAILHFSPRISIPRQPTKPSIHRTRTDWGRGGLGGGRSKRDWKT